MKKRLISVFAFALAVSAGAAFVLYQLISTRVTAGAAAEAKNHPTTTTVYVAAHDLAAGVMVTEKDITKQDFVAVPAGAITKKEDIINRGVINPIHRDTPFFDGALAGAGEGAGFASIIPKGMRAIAIHVNDVAGLAGFVIAGMHVDILVTGTPPTNGRDAVAGQMSKTLLQNINVLSAGQNYQKDTEGKPVMVTVVNLLVTPEQAEVMTLATDERIQLVLRNPADDAIAQTSGAVMSNLFGGVAAGRPTTLTGTVAGYMPARSTQRSSDDEQMAASARASAAARAAAAVAAATPPPAPRPPTIEVLSGNSRTEIIMSSPAPRNQSTSAPQYGPPQGAKPQTSISLPVSGWPVSGTNVVTDTIEVAK
jgi:pilus assembly protein CpaB